MTHSHSLYKAQRSFPVCYSHGGVFWKSAEHTFMPHMDVMIGLKKKSKWTNHATVFSMLCFPASCLNVSLALEIFFHSFSQQPIQSHGWIFQCMGISRICVWVFVCVCVCVVLSFVFTVNVSVQSQHASCLNRDGFEQTFIFIHISCKNNANRRNDRESVYL